MTENMLTLPADDLTARLQGAVLKDIENDPRLQPSTKRQYTKALKNYLATGGSLTDPDALAAYAATVGTSTRSFLAAAVNRAAATLERLAKGAATPENVLTVQAAVYRAQALQGAVTVERAKGRKAHTWLTAVQVRALLDACDRRKSGNPEAPIVSQRDRLAIGLLVAAGLRREEAVNLRFEDVKKQPVGGRVRTVLDIQGKGAKHRVVPISDNLAAAIAAWADVVGGKGFVLRALGRNKQPKERMTTTALYNLVQKRGALIGLPDLQPHDLRRTYAQLGYDAGVPITQISVLLGHSSVEVTQRYLNLDLDLETTISDFVPFQ